MSNGRRLVGHTSAPLVQPTPVPAVVCWCMWDPEHWRVHDEASSLSPARAPTAATGVLVHVACSGKRYRQLCGKDGRASQARVHGDSTTGGRQHSPCGCVVDVSSSLVVPSMRCFVHALLLGTCRAGCAASLLSQQGTATRLLSQQGTAASLLSEQGTAAPTAHGGAPRKVVSRLLHRRLATPTAAQTAHRPPASLKEPHTGKVRHTEMAKDMNQGKIERSEGPERQDTSRLCPKLEGAWKPLAGQADRDAMPLTQLTLAGRPTVLYTTYARSTAATPAARPAAPRSAPTPPRCCPG